MILFDDQLIDRSRARVDIEDRGYQFGDGVYEVIRVYGGKAFRLGEHLDRLRRSAEEIRLELPYSTDQLHQLLKELIQYNRLEDGTVYLQVTRGTAPRSHAFPERSRPLVTAYTTPAPRPLEYLNNGIRTVTAEDIRWLRCDIKSLNLLGAVLAKQKAVDHGCQETILHRDGKVTEGSSTNVFMVKDGTVFTHPANHLILHGITRAVTLELAGEAGIPVKEEAFFVDELFRADELFVTGTTMEISPIIAVDGRKIGNGRPGPVTRKLQQAFEQRIATP